MLRRSSRLETNAEAVSDAATADNVEDGGLPSFNVIQACNLKFSEKRTSLANAAIEQGNVAAYYLEAKITHK